MISLREHPLRRQVVGEMRLRRWPAFTAPALVIQILRLVGEDERDAEQAALGNLPDGWSIDPAENRRHLGGSDGQGRAFVWERHSEASAITLFAPAPDALAVPGLEADPRVAAFMAWAAAMPGEVMRATRIAVVADEAEAERLASAFAFAEAELVSCRFGAPGQAAARIWSDFRLGEGGFGHLLVAAGGLAGADLSRLIQRLQELGNYRNLALLGLPVAQGAWGELNRIERQLSRFARDVSEPQSDDDALLEQVSALSLDLMTIATAASFRMSASAAYAQLVDDRLAELAPIPIAPFQSLRDFTQRRLLPAVRTCAAHSRREAELSERAARFTALLRTRIETRMEHQNARLIESMERSAAMQLRLQQLVEGLSVVALGYYCVGLIGYVLKGAERFAPRLDVPVILAAAVPLVLVAVAGALHVIKRRLLGRSGA